MLLKVEGEVQEIKVMFGTGTYSPSDIWSFSESVNSRSAECHLKHPTSGESCMKMWYNGGKLHLMNIQEKSLKYQVHDLDNDMWTFATEIAPSEEHELQVNSAHIWLQK